MAAFQKALAWSAPDGFGLNDPERFIPCFQNHQVLEAPNRVQAPSNKALGTHRRSNGDFVIDGLCRQRRGCRHL